MDNKKSIADAQKSASDEQILARLKAYAESVHGSVRQMSMAIGRSVNYFASYFQANKIPSLHVLKSLQSHGLDLYWLFTGTEFSLDIGPIDDDILAERARVVQSQWVKAKDSGSPDSNKPLKAGRVMEDQTVSELWDQFSAMFPAPPMWETLRRDDQSDVLHEISQTILREMKRLSKSYSQNEEAP